MALYMGFRHAAFSVASPVSAVAAAGLSVLVGLLSGERPGALSLAGMLLTAPAIVAVSLSAARLDAAAPDKGDSAAAAASAVNAPGADEDAGTSAVDSHMAGVVWAWRPGGAALGGGWAAVAPADVQYGAVVVVQHPA